eukprot:5408192-Amphidinium_carterae.1
MLVEGRSGCRVKEAAMSSEKRIDPEDGKAYAYEELLAYYKGKYKKTEIASYWEEVCKPNRKGKGGQGKAKSKAASKAAPKPIEPEMPDAATGLCVCGEALIDFLPCAGKDGEETFRGVCGGSPFNCCVAAQRLQIPVTYLGVLSNDLFGEKLHKHLEKEGVDMSSIVRLSRPTTLAFVVRSATEGEQYAFFKENAADRALKTGDVQRACAGKRFKAVHMSLGAVTLEHDGMQKAFQVFFKRAAAMKALRCFDPNLRPNMITGAAEKYSGKIEKLLRSVDLVKASADDAEFLYGADCSMAGTAAKWLKLGPKLVVFTRGSKGAQAFVQMPDEAEPTSVEIAPPGERPNTVGADGKPSPVVDTVGAGDTFMGGLIAGCLGGTDSTGATLLPQLVDKEAWSESSMATLKEVIRRAAVCAAITCSRAGADPPTLLELQTATEALA